MRLIRYKYICFEQCTVKCEALKLFFEDKCTEVLVKAIYFAKTKCSEMDSDIGKNKRIKI